MQHLVVNEILEHEARDLFSVEDAADYDRIVGGIEVAKAIPGLVLTPGHLRTPEKPVEEAPVQLLEDFVKVVDLTLR